VKGNRVQVTVRLEPRVLQAAKQRASELKVSLSAALAEAAKESLLSSYRNEREQEILKAADRNFHALRRLEQQLRVDIQVLKEMVGLGMRSFFNHTTAIPDTLKTAALLSGKQRFHRFLDLLARNLRTGESILSDIPSVGPESEAGKSSSQEEAATKSVQPQETAKSIAGEGVGASDRRPSPAHTAAHSSSRQLSHGRESWGLFGRSDEK
jgi:hypothetical protein